MSALFLKDLAQKTPRGLEGRVRNGKSAGGISFGYQARRELRADGTVTTGERVIDPEQAAIVARIFTEYLEVIPPAPSRQPSTQRASPPPTAARAMAHGARRPFPATGSAAPGS